MKCPRPDCRGTLQKHWGQTLLKCSLCHREFEDDQAGLYEINHNPDKVLREQGKHLGRQGRISNVANQES